jgi:hypothetical protein
MRLTLAAAALAALLAGPGVAQSDASPVTSEAATPIAVAKTSGCGCCLAWMERLEAAGFAPEATNMWSGEIVQHKMRLGLSAPLFSCHTGEVEGYVIEGHVPPEDIGRLLAERPDAIGLSVPGMPVGSPGMEYGENRDAYDVLLVRRDGSTEVFASYPAR